MNTQLTREYAENMVQRFCKKLQISTLENLHIQISEKGQKCSGGWEFKDKWIPVLYISKESIENSKNDSGKYDFIEYSRFEKDVMIGTKFNLSQKEFIHKLCAHEVAHIFTIGNHFREELHNLYGRPSLKEKKSYYNVHGGLFKKVYNELLSLENGE